jgi:hypothetical protein
MAAGGRTKPMMQVLSGILFSLSLLLAVALGGQTIDHTWGPALVLLGGALLAAGGEGWRLWRRRKVEWVALVLVAAAAGWIGWRCWLSPVREFARSDALLVGGMLAALGWGLVMPARGAALRLVMVALALLGLVNVGMGLYQLGDPTFSWPFGWRYPGFPSGLFGHYNHLADFALVSAALLAARFFLGGDRAGERVVQAAGVLAHVGCVLMAGSRGGMLSLCAAAAALVVLGALVAWRDKSKRFSLLVTLSVAMPLVVVAVAVPVIQQFQERRGIEDASLERFGDNSTRLVSLGLALDTAGRHPWTGGGSRSFGWEKYAAWNPEVHGKQSQNDDFVHNELLQVATDYGWTGALLLIAAVVGVALTGVSGLLVRVPGTGDDALTVGGLAALAGTLLHSNFSFVTHTLPGAMYLGLALGLAMPRAGADAAPSRRAAGIWGALGLGLPLAAVLMLAGVGASRAFHAAWPVWYGSENLATGSPGLALEQLEESVRLWPGAEASGRAGHLARSVAEREGLLPDERVEWMGQAEGLYAEAARLNPYDPEWPVNRANVLSYLGRDGEAEEEFEQAIVLQGGTEGSFRARYYLAGHLYRRWYQAWLKERRAGEALAGFLRARDLLDEAEALTEPWIRGIEGRELRAGLEKTISFLEGAKVLPETPRE